MLFKNLVFPIIYYILLIIFLFLPVKSPFINHKTFIDGTDGKSPNPALEPFKKIAEQNHAVGMTILGYKDDSVRFIYNYGYADIGRKIKVDNDTVFLIASISKTITGMALMKLFDSGLIESIDDDIGKYLGYSVRNPKYPNVPITIKQIMTHTSGINDSGMNNDFISASFSSNPPSLKEVLTPGGSYYNPEIWLDNAPGTFYEYSNLGAIIAGAIIGKVSGKRFDQFVNDEILKPLGMHGGFTIQSISNINKVAVVYQLDEDFVPHISGDDYGEENQNPLTLQAMIPEKIPQFSDLRAISEPALQV